MQLSEDNLRSQFGEWYVSDPYTWLDSDLRLALSPMARGVLRDTIDVYIYYGKLPADPVLLASLLQITPEELDECSQMIARLFDTVGGQLCPKFGLPRNGIWNARELSFLPTPQNLSGNDQ